MEKNKRERGKEKSFRFMGNKKKYGNFSFFSFFSWEPPETEDFGENGMDRKKKRNFRRICQILFSGARDGEVLVSRKEKREKE